MENPSISGGLNLLISGGGTGGHIYPGIAVAQGMVQMVSNLKIGYVGKKGGLEERIMNNCGLPIQFYGIEAQGLSRKIFVSNFVAVYKNYIGYKQASQIITEFEPAVVFGTGGYVSASTVYAAQRKRIPTLILEQNLIPGLANKFLGKKATAVALSFPETASYFPKENVVVTGTPVRMQMQKIDKLTVRQAFGLESNIFTVLVFGGSQGATAINRAVISALKLLEIQNITLQVILQTGQRTYNEIVMQAKNLKNKIVILPYIDDMLKAYAAADLVISRSGAISIAEITVCGLPAILIPYPFATANHQEKNARILEQNGAAQVILESELTAGKLAEAVAGFIRQPQRVSAMAEKSQQLGKPEATTAICNLMQKLAV